jgi:bifunctional dethiobiotin synthetase / adenosylmethionine---8-amino-7-oxononanoate aminotransferase
LQYITVNYAVFTYLSQSRLGSDLDNCYGAFIRAYLDESEKKESQIGALLMEPLMLGAGGLKFIDPLFQKVVVAECRSRGIPIVYDEVR